MRAWELDGTLIWPLRVSSPQFNALTPRPAHQEPGVRAEEEAFAIGGAQAVQPPRRVLFADDPSVCEAPDCRENKQRGTYRFVDTLKRYVPLFLRVSSRFLSRLKPRPIQRLGRSRPRRAAA
jgi:hypothetical protein